MKILRSLSIVILMAVLCSPVILANTSNKLATVDAQTPPSSVLSIGEVATPPISALNPFNPTSDFNLLGMLYDYMFSFNWPPLPEITPVMAGGYSQNANGTEYTLSVRPNLEWSNGTPLNATDLDYTLMLYNESQLFSPSITNMSILNSTTVEFNLSSSSQNFIFSGLISNGFAVLPYQTFSNVSFANLTNFENLNNIVADGPYVFSNYTIGQNPIMMNANPHYWNGPPKLSGVEWYMYSSQSSMFNAYVAGQIDAVPYPGAYSGLQSIANLSGHSLVGPPFATPALTVGAYLNDWVYPTNVTAFRLALAYATNTTLINDELNGPYAPNSTMNEDFLLNEFNQQIGWTNGTGPVPYNYNVSEAKQILTNAGFKYSGSTLEYQNGTAVTLSIKYRTTEPYSQSVATLLSTEWSDIGIAVTPISVPSATLRAGANNDTGWQVIATGVLGPMTNFGVTAGIGVVSSLGDYYVFVNGTSVPWNSTYFNLISQLSNEQVNSSQFDATAQQAATIAAYGVPIIPLFDVYNWLAISNNFYWGNQSNLTGIYYTQAITQLVYWDLSLDAIGPATSSSSSTSTTSSTSASVVTSTTSPPPTSSSTSSSSTSMISTSTTGVSPSTSVTLPITSTTSSSSSSSSTLYIAAAVVVIIIVIVAIAAVMRRGRPAGGTPSATSNP
jgi:peptide/nickel transport system substrate-binding protein